MTKPHHSLSVIIPTLNEADNIVLLIERIDAALRSAQIVYELIVIDDHSTDATAALLTGLGARYPLSMHLKRGPQGKAQSILEGFAHARFDTVCMIDADLQYPPEHIPAMVARIEQGADVVVANRTSKRATGGRHLPSEAYRILFGKLLHGLSVDVQSGLKVFRREVLQRAAVTATRWSFDLEFLTQARSAGYVIESVDIAFEPRNAGQTKVRLLRVGGELALNALRVKLRGTPSVGLLPHVAQSEGFGFHHRSRTFVPYTRLPTNETALEQLTMPQALGLCTLAALLVAALVVQPHAVLVALLAVLTVLYFVDLLFNLFLISRSFVQNPQIDISPAAVSEVPEADWPSYTIFCPLYKEWEVLPQFVSAISQLDYPHDRLQVLLLLEENDPETIAQARQLDLPPYFEIAVVPHSQPKTKPKACNYGLTKATGEFIVIYDAEDVPDPLQLKRAVLAFESAGPQVKCVQAKLNYYNPTQNLLTRLFTAEYSCWFDLILPGLQSINAPIPLGGTSNHFRLSDLRALDGWDAFNVTEDCDLGMRLVKRGYRTAVLNSTTLEEANSDAINWFWQRSRWIKGYIQTYFVHMRQLGAFMDGPRKVNALTFQLVVGGKVLSLFINPLMWALTIAYFALRPWLGPAIESLFPPAVLYVGVFSLVVGNFLYLYYYMIACARREHYGLIVYVLLVPLYWLGMSAAAWMALYKLVRQPHHWSKTRHGLHLSKAGGAPLIATRHVAEPEAALEANA